jgi:hypothetical protein
MISRVQRDSAAEIFILQIQFVAAIATTDTSARNSNAPMHKMRAGPAMPNQLSARPLRPRRAVT